jgi:hypothetical protein
MLCLPPAFHSDRKGFNRFIEAARPAGRTAANIAIINRANTDTQMETGSALLV